MAIEIHSGIPPAIVAGDTVKWREAEPEDESDVAEAKVVFTREGGTERFEAVGALESGTTNYLYKIDGNASGAAPAGVYVGSRVVQYNTERGRNTDTASHTVTVRPDPLAEKPESHAAKMVRLIESFLESDERFLDSHNTGGVQIEKVNRTEARALLMDYRAELDRERRQERINQGRQSGRRILTEFQ